MPSFLSAILFSPLLLELKKNFSQKEFTSLLLSRATFCATREDTPSRHTSGGLLKTHFNTQKAVNKTEREKNSVKKEKALRSFDLHGSDPIDP